MRRRISPTARGGGDQPKHRIAADDDYRAGRSINTRLQKLKASKLVEEGLGKWRVTPKGMKEISECQR
jgi:hypothetical protein